MATSNLQEIYGAFHDEDIYKYSNLYPLNWWVDGLEFYKYMDALNQAWQGNGHLGSLKVSLDEATIKNEDETQQIEVIANLSHNDQGNNEVLNQEKFQVLQENVNEYRKFCGQLTEHCLDVNFLLNLCIGRRKEFDEVLHGYQENPTDTLLLELIYKYYAVNTLCDTVRESHCNSQQGNQQFYSIPKEILEFDIS